MRKRDESPAMAPAWERTALELRLNDCAAMLFVYGLITVRQRKIIFAQILKSIDKRQKES